MFLSKIDKVFNLIGKYMKYRVWWVQPMGGCRLLYFVKSKNGKNFAVLLCYSVNTFILLYFLRWQKGGATAPLATPLNPPLGRGSASMRIIRCTHLSIL